MHACQRSSAIADICRFRQSKAERESTISGFGDSPMKLSSRVFSHMTAAVMAEKRTEREQIALVEAMLWQMFKPNSKRCKQVAQLRKSIIKDKWLTANLRVITEEGISEALEERRLSQTTDPSVGGNKQSNTNNLATSQPQMMQGSVQQKVAPHHSTGVGQNSQQLGAIAGMRMPGMMPGMMQPHAMQPAFQTYHMGACSHTKSSCFLELLEGQFLLH
jgi:hypothetical protein